MKLAVPLTAACLLAAAGSATAEDRPGPPDIVWETIDSIRPPATVEQDKCVVSYVDGRWEIVCLPYGEIPREYIDLERLDHR